jgi:hypothetical protein
MTDRPVMPDRPGGSTHREPGSEAGRLREQAAALRELVQNAAAPSIASLLLNVAEDLERRAALLEGQK